MSVGERTIVESNDELALNELNAALQEHRAVILRKNGTLTLELHFAGGMFKTAETSIRTCKKLREYKSPN